MSCPEVVTAAYAVAQLLLPDPRDYGTISAVVDALDDAGLLRPCTHLPADETELLERFETEREELATAIVKAVNGQYIGSPPPMLTGWAERAVAGVLNAGWLPPAAVAELLAGHPR